ncbi:hypothetical protein HNV10_14730 [Winogradskyella litoriviva]|uniref:Uncharacterized protein n=1 Tax=Winogradskyella litoriviva TaxID=1220182 RepID=A0ABX2E7K8_9FLAO|nr:hypothetical protein [Winogradskyella litoriviva]NRD24511.1 hypothetical protein [Winogradskyella litoriviva]
MKNLKQLFLLVTISVMSFSCGSDDDGGSDVSGALIYGDTEYELKSGIISNYGDYYEDGVYNFDISLLSSEFTISDDEVVPDDAIISGVYFELFTETEGDLEVGTYSFDSFSFDANTFNDGEVYLNVSVDSLEDETSFEVTSGSFTVLDNGSSYEFEFEGTLENGQSFSGYYNGSLYAEDYSSEDLDRSATVSYTNSKRKLFNN